MDVRSPLFQNIATLLVGVMFLNPILSTAAELAVDAAAGGNTHLGNAGNGVPIVNIATPNGSGLSHNKFTDYNVGQQGLILNNATQKTQGTQLGGLILGNPNLDGTAAQLILNEVTGGNASQLRGYTEVAGQAAHVVVANPHGITCDGCGFINTPRATLSTGKPIVENGRLGRFDVEGGEIAIEGAGLNASNISQFDLITRSAKLNAELHANQLNIVTGRNEVDAATLAATAKLDDGSTKPLLAIDSSALGGMYAGAIRLVGTEQGVGVKLAGDMAASAGDIQIDAKGQLSLAQTAASAGVRLAADSVDLGGPVYAGTQVQIQARDALVNRQSLAARDAIVLGAGQLTNSGVIEAGVNADNSRNLSGDVRLSGDSLRNSGTVVASRELSAQLGTQLDNRAGTLSGQVNTVIDTTHLDNSGKGRVLSQGTLAVTTKDLDNQAGLIASGKDLSVSATAGLNNQAGEISSQASATLAAGQLDNQGGLIAAGRQLNVNASNVNNRDRGTLSSQGDLNARVTGTLDNQGEGALISQGALSVQAQTLDNSQGGLLSSQGSLTVTQAALNNQGGVIVANQQLSLAGRSLDNRNGGLVSGKADVGVEVDEVLDNSGQGSLVADGALNLSAAELRNGNRGQVAAKGDLEITVGELSQQGDNATLAGELLSEGHLTLDAQNIDNRQGGLIAATQGLDIQASNSLRNGAGEISTQDKASVRVLAAAGQPAALLDNSGAGVILADQGLELWVQRLLNNAKGVLAGRDRLVLMGGSLDNSAGGTLSSQQALSVTLTGALDNQGQGALLSGGTLVVDAASLDNRAGGLLSSAGALSISQGRLDNQGGKLVSDGQLNIANASLNNSNAGIISAKQGLSIVTGQLDNQQQGLINAGAGLTLTAGQLNNHGQGLIAGKGAVQVIATGLDQHDGGELISETALTLDLHGGALNNSGQGLIATPGALLLKNLGTLDNSAGGEISSSQGFLLQAHQLDNRGGRIISGQTLALQITQALLNNLKGVLSAAKLTVAAATLDNSAAGVLASEGDLEIALGDRLNNQDQGQISAGQALSIHSAGLDNSNQGLLASGGALRLTTGAANNQGGVLTSQGSLNATTANLDNRGGVLSSQQALTLSAAAVDNRDNGLITSAAGLTLTADSLDSSFGGEVSAKQDLRLTVVQLIQRQGRLIGEAGVRLDLKGGDLDNRGGLLSAAGPLSLLNLGRLDNRDAGEVSSSQSYSLTANGIDNGEQGRLISAGTLTLEVGDGDLRNAGGGLVSGWQGLTLNAGNLDNSSLGTLSSRDGDLKVQLSGALNNRGEGALVGKGTLTVAAASLDNSARGILSNGGDLELNLGGALNNRDGGLIDSQGRLTATAGAVDNHGAQISSQQAGSLTAASLDNSAGQLSSAAALSLTLAGQLNNSQQAVLTSAGPLVLKAQAIDNRGGSLLSQHLFSLTASHLNNADGGTLAAREALGIVLTGALNNSANGLIHSEQGVLAIQAQSLNNNGGALSSQQDLTLSLDGKLDNQSGRIESLSGSLDLQQSSEIDNSGGVLSSLTGWLKLLSAGLFDNDAGITQAQSLDITAQGIDNRAGHLSALSGDTRITAAGATFNNQGGGLYAHQLLAVIAGDFNNQGLAPGLGGQVAAGRIDFGLSGALNNGHGILESGGTLELASASLDNQHGSLRALGASGDTQIDSAALDNRNGLIETANTNLQLDVAGLQSGGGRILHVGSGAFGLSAAQVMGAGGDLITNGLLSLTADSWTNSGVLQAGQLVLNIGTFTQTASGQLLAGQSLTGTGTTWVNHGLLASDGTLSLNLSGAYSGTGQVTSLGDLSVNAGSLELDNSARIVGGDLTRVNVSGLLSNHGSLTSAGDLAVSAGTLHNHGTLGGAQWLRIDTPTLLNENGLIFSGEDLTLRVDSFTNRYADIYSLGALDLAGDDLGGLASRFDNLSGTLESAGDLSLKAAVINNARAVLSINDAGKYTAKITELPCSGYYGAGDCSGKRNGVWEVIERDKLEVTAASAASSLQAGGNLLLVGNALTNSSSLISAGGHLTATLTSLDNRGVETGEIENRRVFTSERTRNIGSWQNEANQFTSRYWYLNPGYDPNNLGGLEAALSHFIGRTEREQTQFRTTTTLASGDQAYAGIIQAAGDVSITASQRIDNGVIRPSYAYVAGGTRGGSTDTGGSRFSTPISLNAQLPPDLQQRQVNPLTLPGFSLPQGENGLFRLSGQNAANGAARTTQGPVADSTQAGSAVTVNAGLGAQGPVAATGSAWSLQSGQGAGVADGATVDSAALQVTGVPGLPSSAQPSTSHRYLIETNPALTSLKQFLGTDYLLGLLGYDLDTTQRRLGDGLYEQRLIQQAIVARTGQRFLAGLSSDEAMFKHLMDNALASKDALNLSLGVGLSAEQVAALTHDLVWLESHEVNGEKVLVPVLYLAQAEGRLAPNGALIQGRDLALISGGELNNAGTLRASANLSASANRIDNRGLLQAGERLSLLATDSLRNAQGGIIAGRDVSAIALTGDIRNERSVTTHESSKTGFERREDFIDSAARIEASNRLSLSAGRDLINQGGQLTAGGDVDLSAGRDLLLISQSETDVANNRNRKGYSNRAQVTQYGSAVQVGGNLIAEAGRDLAIVASTLKAAGDIALQASGDLTIASAANESHRDAYRKSGGKKVTAQEDSVRQQGAVIDAGGDLDIEAGNNLMVVASHLKAGDEAFLYAGDQLALLSAEDSDYHLYDMKKKGGWGSKEAKRDEVTDVRNMGSSITTGGDLTLESGGDQLYRNAKLDSGADLTLDSGGAITFEAVKDKHQESHDESSNSWVWTSMDSKGKVDETLRQSQLTAKGEVLISAVDGLHLDVKQVDQQTISQSIDAMVQADPSMAWLKDVEARGDVDWRQVREVHDRWSDSHSGLGGPAMIIIAIIVTYFTAGAASGLVGSAAGATAGSGTAFAAGTAATAATTTTAATAATAAGWANVAATAVMTSAASTATISTINNKGDVGAALQETFNSDNLKNYVVAGATAGLTAGLYNEWTGTQTGGGTALTDSTRGALANGGKVAVSNPGGLSSWQGVGQFAANQALQNTTSAVLNKALGRDGSLGDALQSSLANTFAAFGFNLVGDIGQTNNLQEGGLGKIGLHAVMGGLAAEAAGGDFKIGALAAGINEALIDHLATQYAEMPQDKRDALLVMNSQLIGVLTAAAQGGDEQALQTGSWVAGSATSYNRLLHDAEKKALEAEAKALEERLGKPESSVAWEDLLLLAASAELDAAENRRLQALLDSYGSGNPEGVSFAQDLLVARESIQQLAAKNTVLTWSDGRAITANGDRVVAFQSTASQFQDHGLFNTDSQWSQAGGRNWADDSDIVPTAWKEQFGERDAAVYLRELAGVSSSQEEFDGLVQRVSEVAQGGINNVTWDLDAALALSGAPAVLRALLTKRAASAGVGGLVVDGAKGTSVVNEVPQITLNRQNGTAFERQVVEAFGHVGGAKNTAPVTVQLPNGAQVTTIPDLWGKNVGGLLEVKNVQNLSMSNQLRAQIKVASDTGQPLNLVVSPKTSSISGRLIRQVRSTGGDVYRYNPATGELTKF